MVSLIRNPYLYTEKKYICKFYIVVIHVMNIEAFNAASSRTSFLPLPPTSSWSPLPKHSLATPTNPWNQNHNKINQNKTQVHVININHDPLTQSRERKRCVWMYVYIYPFKESNVNPTVFLASSSAKANLWRSEGGQVPLSLTLSCEGLTS